MDYNYNHIPETNFTREEIFPCVLPAANPIKIRPKMKKYSLKERAMRAVPISIGILFRYMHFFLPIRSVGGRDNPCLENVTKAMNGI